MGLFQDMHTAIFVTFDLTTKALLLDFLAAMTQVEIN